MRSKLAAFLILGVVFLTPMAFYWYYYHVQVVGIYFSTTDDIDFTVSLQGTLDYSYLPLADKALSFTQTCHKSCLVAPIPPVQYTITIASDSKNTIHDSILFSKEGNQNYEFHLSQLMRFEKIGDFSYDESLPEVLALNANTNITGSFLPLGILRNKHVFALKNSKNSSDIGTLTADKFSPVFTLPFTFLSGRIDASKNYFILKKTTGEQYITSPSGKGILVFPYNDHIILLDKKNNIWKVKTEKGVYSYENGAWMENPRFSDYIDIDPRYRVGYIDTSDTEKLKLGNFQMGTSYILLLDRSNGQISVIEKNRNITGFMNYEGSPAYINNAGEIYGIKMEI